MTIHWNWGTLFWDKPLKKSLTVLDTEYPAENKKNWWYRFEHSHPNCKENFYNSRWFSPHHSAPPSWAKLLLCCGIGVGQKAHQLWADAAHGRHCLMIDGSYGGRYLLYGGLRWDALSILNSWWDDDLITWSDHDLIMKCCQCWVRDFDRPKVAPKQWGKVAMPDGSTGVVSSPTCRISSLKGAATSSASTFGQVEISNFAKWLETKRSGF